MIFKDKYNHLSGWIHDYYCDKDGSELIFDLNNEKYFECPKCKCKYTDEKRHRAWITKYRYFIFSSLEKSSLEYLSNKNDETLSFIVNALNYYSSNYDRFPLHNKTGKTFETVKNGHDRCGRITAQGLNEAMICIQLVNCMDNIHEFLEYDSVERVYKVLFPKISELLIPQIDKIHNICLYEVCAVAMMGIVSKNEKMINFAFNSKYSFFNQLNNGVTKDDFWFEGSFHYHFFALEPILETLKLCKKYDYEIPNKYIDKAYKMLKRGFKCSFKDCSLPSPNDGWPNRTLTDYLKVYDLAKEVFPKKIGKIINEIYEHNNPYRTIHCLHTGFSLLKSNGYEVFIKYGDVDNNHAHPDKLNIEVKYDGAFLTHDLSTSGYGTNISKEYYKKSCSHNTVVIDGKDQNLASSYAVQKACIDEIEVSVNNAYENTFMKRHIEIKAPVLKDTMTVKCDKQRTVDYIFHCDAILTTELQTIKVDSFPEYPFFRDIEKVILSSKKLILEWVLVTEKLISTIDLEGKEMYICHSPDNPDITKRTTIIVRSCKNDYTSFSVLWQ